MENLGQAFKELREARHISLAEATGEAFSPSMLSRFESGKNDISAYKLFVALENTHIEVNEYLYLARGFSKSRLVELQEKIHQLELENDYKGLQKLYYKEISENYKTDLKSHMVNALVIKAHLKGLDDTTKLTEDEEEFLYDYLFGIEIWGKYELTLFSISSTLLTPDLFTRYAREMLRRTDFLGSMNDNRVIIQTMLLNGLLLCIEKDDFINVNFFDKQIQSNFYKENETYYRIIYFWAKGLLTYKNGKKQEGIEQCKQATTILKSLDCHQAAKYYDKALEKMIHQIEK